jgi:predicted glycosyltransferase
MDPGDLRALFGSARDEKLCIVTVGGSGVGTHLLDRVLDAVPIIRARVPELNFLVVTGPRIDPRSLRPTHGTSIVGYVPDLDRYLAACDLAIVQGGLTTCMELTAANTPFIYVPLRNHFEQNIHVRRRLDQYGAGRCLPYEEAADPDQLAAAVVAALAVPPAFRPVETDGAERIAHLLADLI